MRIAEFESVTPDINEATLPCRLEQRAATLGPALLLALLIPLAFLLLAPLAVIAGEIATNPSTRTELMAHPGGAAKIGLGLGLIALLIAWPVRAALDRVGRRRIIVIDLQEVSVTDKGMFKTRTWRRPLASYVGLAHHVRTTHSRLRHELILAHPCRKDSVLLALAPHTSEAQVRALAQRIGVAIVPAATLYRRAPDNLQPLPARAAREDLASARARAA